MPDITQHGPETNILFAGTIITVSTLPLIKQVTVVFSERPGLVEGVVSAALAIVSLLMLLSRLAAKQQSRQDRSAAQLADALRAGIL